MEVLDQLAKAVLITPIGTPAESSRAATEGGNFRYNVGAPDQR